MSLNNKKIGFIGGGNMAKAIAEGILKKGLVKPSQLFVSTPSDTTLETWKAMSVKTTNSNAELIDNSDIVFLAFKPYQLECALDLFDYKFKKLHLFISILAGVKSDVIYEKLEKYTSTIKPRLVRVMPNTPAMVCEGCSAIAPHYSATSEDVELVKEVFMSMGKCEVVPEHLISAVTGLTGSGPAYIYMMIEALSDGGVKQGLPRNLATTFAAQTVLGAAKMVLETKKHPGELKDEVCSAGGTTIYGVHALEKGNLRATLINAVEAAVSRAEELGRITK